MVKLTQSLRHWLYENYLEELLMIMFGHVELFTPEMQKEYMEWCETDDGKQYLRGGSKYIPDPEIEAAFEQEE